MKGRTMQDARDTETSRGKAEARARGMELLTPNATAALFRITPAAVRQARLRMRVYSPFSLEVAGRPADLLTLESAVAFWGEASADTLDLMRDNGLLITICSNTFNVLHTRPMICVR